MNKDGLKARKLICVTTDNNNKFYNMRQINSNEWEAEWGRVGVTSTKKTYAMREWEKKYNEKLNKGYKDQTNLFVVSEVRKDFAEIRDKSIAGIVNDLQRFANHSIVDNYIVTVDEVTEIQISEAQRIIDSLSHSIVSGNSTISFNKKLVELWMTVPRRISNTREAILQFGAFNTQDKILFAEKMLAEEQATLDVMRGQVNVSGIQSKEDLNTDLTILDAMGLVIELCSNAENDLIKSKLGEIENKFICAWKVKNNKTQGRFDNFVENCKNKKKDIFWHGSRNENWWSILQSGLVLRPANAVITGKMFGIGTYFADKARKSYGYTSAKGSYWAKGNANRCFMCLYDVHLGKSLHIKKHQHWCYDLTEKKLKDRGEYDSLFAEGGVDLRNNEYIVYNENQCTVKYLVELSS